METDLVFSYSKVYVYIYYKKILFINGVYYLKIKILEYVTCEI